MDFYRIEVEERKSNNRKEDYKVSPNFLYGDVKDLVCKGGDMYAFWKDGKWNTSIRDLIVYVDNDVLNKVNEIKEKIPYAEVGARYFQNHNSRVMQDFAQYTKLAEQSTQQFNTKIIFSDDEIKREDYSTNQLNYTPSEGDTPAFDELTELLYRPKELEKILWFMGALLTNNMSKIQKFLYLYGGKGTGKGTIIKIFKMLFEGYYATIDLMHLTGGSEFATSQVKEVPLLIDDDADISKITKDTNLLKLTAHEPLTVNIKYKETYDIIFNGLLITASNQRFKVRNIDSGITRRAVVAEPTSLTHNAEDYVRLMSRVKFEIPHIANKAIQVYQELGPYHYENYIDVKMAEQTDIIFAFVREYANVLGNEVSLKKASELYKLYLEDMGFDTNGYKRTMKRELNRYYSKFIADTEIDGVRVKNLFRDQKRDVIFPEGDMDPPQMDKQAIEMDGWESEFDKIAKDYPAQYATESGTPEKKWDDVTTTLKDIDTSRLHYVRLPMNHIVIDFDLTDEDGNKDLETNMINASRFPETYAELSKSGNGVHLHYIYDGDVGKLAPLYEDDVEIKVFKGKSSLRRKLTSFNQHGISRISTGLPIKEKDGVKVYKDVEIITWNEKKMRTAIKGNLEKKYHDATKPSMDFIKHIFDEAEKNGVKYDLRDMRHDILVFASRSTNQAPKCIKIANSITYTTIDDVEDTRKMQDRAVIFEDEHLVFYDVEVFPNLFVVSFKRYGDDKVTSWINPTSEQIEFLVEQPLVGFNNRRYDNHILYARLLGEDNLSLYRQSQRIINKDSGGFYGGAYELSYADIYEYASKKQSLKKWEIELGIKHDELEFPWDQPIPEEEWDRVVEYCENDVRATEEVFKGTYYDYNARRILATLSGLKINATTTQHAAAFLFGDDKRPQDKFVYTDLSEEFPGYKYSYGKSEYRGEDPSEGGYVYAEPGIYRNVALLDVASMHPNSLINMNYFGPYTQRYKDLVETRIHIKNKRFKEASEMFEGRLKPYLEEEDTAEALGYALKIIINIVYGMTSAKFDNKFKHKDNVDNIIAKRGALFMIDLKNAVQEKGYSVAHIKTDSIKIPEADEDIIEFVHKFGEKYGYDFEHEVTFNRFALVNKAVYIADYKTVDGETKWDAVGAQFAEPYVYKKLFSKEEIVEDDYAITKQATAPIYIGETYIGKVARVYASYSGDEMFRVAEDKRSYVSGTKNFKWRLFKDFAGKEDIDMKYYDELLAAAIKSIEKVGDVNIMIEDELPELPF